MLSACLVSAIAQDKGRIKKGIIKGVPVTSKGSGEGMKPSPDTRVYFNSAL